MDKTKKHILKRAGTCVAVVLMLYLFNRLTNQAFFSQRNLTMLLKQASVLMILTSSLMLLLIETNIDLSGGAGVYPAICTNTIYSIRPALPAPSLWSTAAGPFSRPLWSPLWWVS